MSGKLFKPIYAPRLIEFFLSLFCSRTSQKKEEEEGRSGHILRLLRTEQSSFSLSLSLPFSFTNETRNNYIH
jgi:hypothetical protein